MKRDGRRLWVAINLALGLVLVASLAVGIGFGLTWYSAWRASESHGPPVDAASRGVLALMSVSPSTIDADLAAVEDMATGVFAEELEKGVDKVKETVLNGVVTQEAEILKAGYSEGDSDSAVVILAVDTTTTYAAQAEPGDGEGDTETPGDKDKDGVPDPVTNHYRVKADMALVEGQWLIAKLEIA